MLFPSLNLCVQREVECVVYSSNNVYAQQAEINHSGSDRRHATYRHAIYGGWSFAASSTSVTHTMQIRSGWALERCHNGFHWLVHIPLLVVWINEKTWINKKHTQITFIFTLIVEMMYCNYLREIVLTYDRTLTHSWAVKIVQTSPAAKVRKKLFRRYEISRYLLCY